MKASYALLIYLLIALSPTGICEKNSETERIASNVIPILADDMGLGDLSSLNGGLSYTPNLNRLKEESVWFNQAYSASPVCAPARAALLTGRYPHRAGVVTLNMKRYPNLTRIREDEKTLADIFSSNDYTTGLIGKWHSGIGEEFHPLARGFRYMRL